MKTFRACQAKFKKVFLMPMTNVLERNWELQMLKISHEYNNLKSNFHT